MAGLEVGMAPEHPACWAVQTPRLWPTARPKSWDNPLSALELVQVRRRESLSKCLLLQSQASEIQGAELAQLTRGYIAFCLSVIYDH